MKPVKLREVQWLGQDHTTSKEWLRISSSGRLTPESTTTGPFKGHFTLIKLPPSERNNVYKLHMFLKEYVYSARICVFFQKYVYK